MCVIGSDTDGVSALLLDDSGTDFPCGNPGILERREMWNESSTHTHTLIHTGLIIMRDTETAVMVQKLHKKNLKHLEPLKKW